MVGQGPVEGDDEGGADNIMTDEEAVTHNVSGGVSPTVSRDSTAPVVPIAKSTGNRPTIAATRQRVLAAEAKWKELRLRQAAGGLIDRREVEKGTASRS
jgi:hypothetical protein